jgi:class 3 adenylate cyclase
MRACAACGGENPANARFCLHCGAPIDDAATPARMERKFATALFADLVGSTSPAEQQDPEVVQSVVGRTFDRLSAEIERYGGHLEKFMGDAVLAVFAWWTSLGRRRARASIRVRRSRRPDACSPSAGRWGGCPRSTRPRRRPGDADQPRSVRPR